MLKNTLILYVALSLVSCTADTKKRAIQTFEETVSLKNELTGIKTISSGNIGLMVIDTVLIIQKSTEPFIELYSTNSNKLIKTFGEYGEGPGKIMDPVLVKGIEYRNGEPIIKVFDTTKRLMNEINLNNLLTNGQPVLMQTTIPFTGNYIMHFHYADQDNILSTTEGNGRFTNYNYKKDSVNYIPYIPDLPFFINENNKSYVFRSSVAVNKEKGVFAAFPIYVGSVDFFDFNGNLIKSTFFEDPVKLEQSLKDGAASQPHFFVRDSDSDKNYIYGLNINNTITDLNGDSPNKLSILVFDWEGNPVTEYILESDQASESMAFDPIHKRFYTYCRDCEESNILQFNIPE